MRTPTPTPSRHQAERGLITSAGRGGFWLKISLASCKVPPLSLSASCFTGRGRDGTDIFPPSLLSLLPLAGPPHPFPLPLHSLLPPASCSVVKGREIQSYGSTLPKLLWPCYLRVTTRPVDPSHRIHSPTHSPPPPSRAITHKLQQISARRERGAATLHLGVITTTMYFLSVLIRVIFRILTFVANITLFIYLCFRPEQSPLIPS